MPVPAIRFADESKDAKTPVHSGRRKSDVRQSPGFFRWLVSLALRLLTYFAIFSALFTCGSSPLRFDYSTKDSRAVCRSLAHAKVHLTPLATPLVRAAHQRIDPYTGPYVRAAAPYAQKAYKLAKPHYDRAYKHGEVLYSKHVEPARKRAVKRGRAYADPHVKRINAEYKKLVQPHFDTLHKSVKPYRDIYTRDVAPYVTQAQAWSLAAASTSQIFYVKQVHPRLLTLLKHLRSFYINHFAPALHRTYVLYVQPQIDYLTFKVFGYMPERQPKPSGFVQQIKESVASAADRGKENLSKAATIPTEVAQTVQDAVTTALGRDRPDTGSEAKREEEVEEESTEDLDRQLDAELEYITNELETWERGMSRLIRDELKTHKKRIKQPTEDFDLAKERKASVAILRRYLREATKSYNKLMEAAKFERSVEDFEGWDKGLGVRMKLFLEDLEELEQQAAEAKEATAAAGGSAETSASEAVEAVDEQKLASSLHTDDSPAEGVNAELLSEKQSAASETTDNASSVTEDVEEPEPAHSASLAEGAVIEAEQSIDASNETEVSQPSSPTPAEQVPSPSSIASDEHEPTFSILPIEVADEKGTPVEEQKDGSAESEVRSADTAEQVPSSGDAGSDDEPTFSILPIAVSDEDGARAEKHDHIKHEEL